MKTQEQIDEKTLLEEIKEKLQMARQGLDELAVQLALGKAEARDKFEEMKKNFLKRLYEFNETLVAEEKKANMKEKIEELEGELNDSGVHDKKSLGERIEKALAVLEVIKNEIKKKIKTVKEQTDFDHEMEMFRLKLEILKLKINLKKFEVKESFHEQMEEAKKVIDSITGKVSEKIKTGEKKYSGFSDEVQLAYKHFRKALKSLQ